MATRGTAEFLERNGIQTVPVNKVYEGRPNVIDHIKNKEIDLVINTSSGKRTIQDSSSLRQAAVLYGLPYTTTIAAAKAMAWALKRKRERHVDVRCLQEYHQ
jgi:carbamoyl-phosphate synthase large subunit